jgi:hypothetical protein
MSRHVWTVKNLSRETTQRGLYAYCLARNGGRDPHQTDSPPKDNVSGLKRLDALRFAGYAMETLRQTGGRQDTEHPYWPGWIRDIWRGATWSHHRYAKGRNSKGYELAGCKMLASAIRSMYGWTSAGPDEQLGGMLSKLEETADVLPVLHDYLEENRLEECLWVLEGKFGVVSYGATQQRQEAERQVSASNPAATFTSLFAHCVQR